jgi:Raf kinase inhibitor-like YbhB/YbcL family protein
VDAAVQAGDCCLLGGLEERVEAAWGEAAVVVRVVDEVVAAPDRRSSEPGDEVAPCPRVLVVSHHGLFRNRATPRFIALTRSWGYPSRMRRVVAVVVPLVLAVAACGGDDDESPTTTGAAANGLAFTGGDVVEGQRIDPEFTCDGANTSPALAWSRVPEGTAELALVMDDPDAPGGTFTHWVVYAMPADYRELGPGVPPGPSVSGGITLRQGPTDGSDTPGYLGPCPPEGETHDYVFTLYALDQETGLEGGASVDDLRAAMEGHVIAEATLTAPYARS